MAIGFDCLEPTSSGESSPLIASHLADVQVGQSAALVQLSQSLSLRRPRFSECWVNMGDVAPPTPESFSPPSVDGGLFFGKPSSGGLFTSHMSGDDHGMWRTYLDATASVTVHGLPWTDWELPTAAGARLAIVDGAQGWCQLVRRYPLPTERGLGLDWSRASQSLDGIEITLLGVFATHELTLEEAGMVFAPVSWTVQSTVWLNWVFSEPRLPSNSRA